MRLYSSLKEEQTCRAIGYRSNLHAVSRYRTRHLIGTRNHISKEFQCTANAHITSSTNAEYREHTADNQTGTDTGTHIVFAQCAFFEELFHQHIVIFGSCLNERFVKFHGFVHFFCRDFQNVRHTAFGFPTIHLHFQYIDNGIERSSCTNRILDRNNLATELVSQLGNCSVVVRFIVIQLIDNEDNGFMKLFCIPELVHCSHFHTILGIQNHQCRIGNVQG